jgi:hypothetical protein
MRKIVGSAVMLMALSIGVFARDAPPAPAPEINPGAALSALALLAAVSFVIRDNRKA